MEAVEARVEDLSHDGCGVVRSRGRAYFIPGALPGERIRFLPGKRRRRRWSGQLESIVEPSPDRVEPPCEYFGRCGGCVLQHAGAGAQRRFKERVLLDNLLRIGRVQADEVLPPVQGADWQYRRKARLGIRNVPKKGGTLVGFRERNRHFITSLSHCRTLDSRISGLLPGLHTLVSNLSGNHRIPQIEVSAGSRTVDLVLRHLEPLTAGDRDALERFARESQVNLFLQSAGPDSISRLWPASPPTPHYRIDRYDLVLEFEATDFIQVNDEANQRMVERVIGFLDPVASDAVLDLFCGLGNFTLAIARSGSRVLGVEGDGALVSRGKSNARLNQLENVQFQQLDLFCDDLKPLWEGRPFNKLLLDPPRSGAFHVATRLVPELRPEIIVYVSCNPATLARDADQLVHAGGYRFSHVGTIDMFPHTAHIESMAVFHRG
ncbi:MAG: 23S rRNA (uracil(1939)-C(5))-methyltransferase RlmD [Gammaproteobacteria bacterium]|nr:23S rRNA (uracil(1939)-C(5))-methyltransferase RlmD [Gammaproteobacteria bacterium]